MSTISGVSPLSMGAHLPIEIVSLYTITSQTCSDGHHMKHLTVAVPKGCRATSHGLGVDRPAGCGVVRSGLTSKGGLSVAGPSASAQACHNSSAIFSGRCHMGTCDERITSQ